jgi:hypothetical protein
LANEEIFENETFFNLLKELHFTINMKIPNVDDFLINVINFIKKAKVLEVLDF